MVEETYEGKRHKLQSTFVTSRWPCLETYDDYEKLSFLYLPDQARVAQSATVREKDSWLLSPSPTKVTRQQIRRMRLSLLHSNMLLLPDLFHTLLLPDLFHTLLPRRNELGIH